MSLKFTTNNDHETLCRSYDLGSKRSKIKVTQLQRGMLVKLSVSTCLVSLQYLLQSSVPLIFLEAARKKDGVIRKNYCKN